METTVSEDEVPHTEYDVSGLSVPAPTPIPVKTFTPKKNPFEQITIEIYRKGSIPPALFSQLESVMYPPTKWSRFTFSDPALYDQLTRTIQRILPECEIKYQPHKAEAPDMTIQAKEKTICKVNFIHMDKPDSPGCIQMKQAHPDQTHCKVVQGMRMISKEKKSSTRDVSKSFVSLMFFYPKENETEYQAIQEAMMQFFKKYERHPSYKGGKTRTASRMQSRKRVTKRNRFTTSSRRRKVFGRKKSL